MAKLTPKGVVNLTYAGFWSRVGALLIDYILIVLIAEFAAVPFWLVAPGQFIPPFSGDTIEQRVLEEKIEQEGAETVVTQVILETYSDADGVYGSCLFESWVKRYGAFETEALPPDVLGPPMLVALFPHENCQGDFKVDVASIFVQILLLFYAPVMESRHPQATFGKMALRIYVQKISGERLSFGRAFLRNIAEVLCWLTLNIGYLISLFTKRRQALHDLISSSVVVKK